MLSGVRAAGSCVEKPMDRRVNPQNFRRSGPGIATARLFAAPRVRLAIMAMLFAALSLTAQAGLPRLSGDLLFASAFDWPTQVAGGSNYHWHTLSPDCEREPHGVLAGYHLPLPAGGSVRARVRGQLEEMRDAGMARLSLGIYFGSGIRTGTVINSSDPADVAQALANLELLLADTWEAGFEEILFRFFPVGAINPSSPGFQPQLLDEYWDLIVAVRPLLVAADIDYRIDLMIEGAPRDRNPPLLPDPWKYPANKEWSAAVRTLWQRYHAAWGSADSVGFSFLTDTDSRRIRRRVRHMRYVYEGNYPPVFAADIYGSESVPESSRFLALHEAMVREDPAGDLGWRDSAWIIAETWYDDPIAAQGLSSAIASTGRRVLYLTHWPLDRADLECTQDVNVAPPVDWLVYGGYGF